MASTWTDITKLPFKHIYNLYSHQQYRVPFFLHTVIGNILSKFFPVDEILLKYKIHVEKIQVLFV